ncbi:hypothetical protein ACJ41O_005915 [Fusarium nematophilum]
MSRLVMHGYSCNASYDDREGIFRHVYSVMGLKIWRTGGDGDRYAEIRCVFPNLSQGDARKVKSVELKRSGNNAKLQSARIYRDAAEMESHAVDGDHAVVFGEDIPIGDEGILVEVTIKFPDSKDTTTIQSVALVFE